MFPSAEGRRRKVSRVDLRFPIAAFVDVDGEEEAFIGEISTKENLPCWQLIVGKNRCILRADKAFVIVYDKRSVV